MRFLFYIFITITFTISSLYPSWKKLNLNQGVNITGIEKIDNTILIVTADLNNKLEPSGILRTTNNGESWLEQDYFLPSFMSIYDIEKTTSDNLYLVAEGNGVFISNDKGLSFTRIFNVSGGYETYKDVFIKGDDILLLSNRNLYMNIDSQDSAFTESLTLNIDFTFTDTLQSVYFDGLNIYLSIQNKGILKSSNLGKTWNPFNNGLKDKIISNISGDNNGNLIISIDGKGLFRWNSLDNVWIPIEETDGIFVNEVECTNLLHYKNSFYFSTNNNIYLINSNEWTIKSLTRGSEIQGVSDIEIYDDTIFFSMAFGGLFTLENDELKEYKIPYCGLKTSNLAENDNYIFQGSKIGTISKTSDYGKTWQNIKSFEFEKNSPIISMLAYENSLIYTSLKGETIYSSNNGDSFQIFENNLILYDLESYNNNIYAISDSGVYYTVDFGENWIFFENTNMIKNCLSMSLYQNKKLLVGTSGNGIYEINLDDKVVKKIDLKIDTGDIIDLEYINENDFIFGFDKPGSSGLYLFDGILKKLNNSSISSIYKRNELILVGQKYGTVCQISYDNGKSFSTEIIEDGGISAEDTFISKNNTMMITFSGSLAGIFSSDIAVSSINSNEKSRVVNHINLNQEQIRITLINKSSLLKSISIFTLEGKKIFENNLIKPSIDEYVFQFNELEKNRLYFISLEIFDNNMTNSITFKVISN